MPQYMDEVEHMSKVPYKSAVGSIMYVMVCTRPYISQYVSVLSMYMEYPGKRPWEAVKWILRYPKGAPDVGLTFWKNVSISILGYVDSDYAGDLDRRTTTGYIFNLVGNVKQNIVQQWSSERSYLVERFHEHTKHVDVRFHFIRDIVEEGAIKVEKKVITDDNFEDTLTKIVLLSKFARYKDLAGVCIN
ncbi:secreted RxLR effector protein 161-like [Solanum lycopersicum]|uniref:secreted RxLR effector protein 161-like n=1 Tax=Solanum lycopersicum TaxID=4081 RepID=UPI00374906B6